MAIAKPAIEITLTAEGNDSPAANNWGVQQNFFDDNRKYIPSRFANRLNIKSRADAEIVLTAIFEGRGFNKINNQDAANFFFDTYFQNQSLYRALVCAIFEREGEFGEMVNRQMTLPDALINDINGSQGDLQEFLGSALWMRRRMSRVFWGAHLWKGFDQQRFVQFPYKLYDINCLPENIPSKLFLATEMLMNRLTYMDKKMYPTKKYTSVQIAVLLKNTKLPLNGVDMTDIYKIGTPFSYKSCLVPTQTAQSDDSVLQNAALGFLAVYILKKIFL